MSSAAHMLCMLQPGSEEKSPKRLSQPISQDEVEHSNSLSLFRLFCEASQQVFYCMLCCT